MGGGRWGHHLCDLWAVCWATQKYCHSGVCGRSYDFDGIKLYMPASVGQPSLHSIYARMVYWAEGHPGGIAGKNKVRLLILLIWFFCLVGILGFGSGVLSSDISGLGGPDIHGQHLPVMLLLRFSMLGVDSWGVSL